MEVTNMKTLYQRMAQTAEAHNNCVKMNNTEWQAKHEQALNDMLDELPHGSGIDGTYSIIPGYCNADKIEFYCQYHAMNENGMYDGWIDYKVIVKASLSHGYKLTITGNFGKYQDIKDYLYDVYTF
jgi:hypothetical protein